MTVQIHNNVSVTTSVKNIRITMEKVKHGMEWNVEQNIEWSMERLAHTDLVRAYCLAIPT